jgi:hypothetical protein
MDELLQAERVVDGLLTSHRGFRNVARFLRFSNRRQWPQTIRTANNVG